jgi:hypothetical protein
VAVVLLFPAGRGLAGAAVLQPTRLNRFSSYPRSVITILIEFLKSFQQGAPVENDITPVVVKIT